MAGNYCRDDPEKTCRVTESAAENIAGSIKLSMVRGSHQTERKRERKMVEMSKNVLLCLIYDRSDQIEHDMGMFYETIVTKKQPVFIDRENIYSPK